MQHLRRIVKGPALQQPIADLVVPAGSGGRATARRERKYRVPVSHDMPRDKEGLESEFSKDSVSELFYSNYVWQPPSSCARDRSGSRASASCSSSTSGAHDERGELVEMDKLGYYRPATHLEGVRVRQGQRPQAAAPVLDRRPRSSAMGGGDHFVAVLDKARFPARAHFASAGSAACGAPAASSCSSASRPCPRNGIPVARETLGHSALSARAPISLWLKKRLLEPWVLGSLDPVRHTIHPWIRALDGGLCHFDKISYGGQTNLLAIKVAGGRNLNESVLPECLDGTPVGPVSFRSRATCRASPFVHKLKILGVGGWWANGPE